MNVVIVGNGLAGTMAAKTVRELDADAEIEVFGEERTPYYPRPHLVEYLAGRLPYEKLFATIYNNSDYNYNNYPDHTRQYYRHNSGSHCRCAERDCG